MPRLIAIVATLVLCVPAVAQAQQSLGRVPGVPSVLPGITSGGDSSSRGMESPVAPGSGQFAPPPNSGPVTGYGPGGMGHEPGTPVNPPYR